MKTFDFKAAKQGAAVCTRSGLPARIICFDADNSLFRVVAMIRNIEVDIESTQEYRENGGWLPAGTESNQDLMMRDDDYQERLARGEYSLDNEADRPTVKESLIVGPSRRDMLAGMAMQGWLSSLGEGEQPIIEKGAELCVRIADALIVELDKHSEK